MTKQERNILLNAQNSVRLAEVVNTLEHAKQMMGRLMPMPIPRMHPTADGCSGMGQIQRAIHVINEAMAEVIAIQERVDGTFDDPEGE